MGHGKLPRGQAFVAIQIAFRVEYIEIVSEHLTQPQGQGLQKRNAISLTQILFLFYPPIILHDLI